MTGNSQDVADQSLVKRVQSGDRRAFDLLVKRYQHKIIQLVGRYVSDQDEALDLAQEVFLKAYKALANFRGESAFYTWLYRIAINTAKNYLISRSKRPQDVDLDVGSLEDQAELKDIETPDRHLQRDEMLKRLDETIENLPEELRTAFILRELEGMSYEEIATVMSCPIGTVRSRIHRARETIDLQIKPMLLN